MSDNIKLYTCYTNLGFRRVGEIKTLYSFNFLFEKKLYLK